MNSIAFQNVSVRNNFTRPPEIFRFVPGVVPTPYNADASTVPSKSFNGSGGFFVEEEVDIGFNDMQTLFLACFATLAPLLVIVIAGFCIRSLWRKYRRRTEQKLYDGVLHTEGSIDSASQPLHTHLLNSDKQSAETHLTIETDEVCEASGNVNSLQNSRASNHSNTNGSIITMTLKNNHLIVETEERNDIEEDSRATKMKYSPSAGGVFVVEVQQGIRRSPGSSTGVTSADVEQQASSDQKALIHEPPNRFSESANPCEAPSPLNKETLNIRTGLTQSDQSLGNFSYCYGNQTEYNNGSYGYCQSDGCNVEPPTTFRGPVANTKPKITSAIFKSQESMRSFEILQDDILISDSLMRSKILTKDDDDSIQEEQNRLGNCANGKNAAKKVIKSKTIDDSEKEVIENVKS